MDESKPRVLVVDDDPDLCALVALHARRWGYEAESAVDAAGLWRALFRSTPDVVLMDVDLGASDGSELVAEVKKELPDLPVIMVTRDHSAAAAVRSMKHGATDYIEKPLDFELLRRAVSSAVELSRLSAQLRALKAGQARGGYRGLVGRSPAMLSLYQRIEKVASADVSVLILGETGTGKELVARTLHEASRRSGGPFVAVNAAAIPQELIESQLFGHEKGAFTGAERAHAGFCEQADGGTLFLDEIGEMRADVQAKLLRFLQDHIVQRVGARASRQVDVRVVAATNIDPEAQIAAGTLRADLFYRLRVVSLELPPLRSRRGDVALLTAHFLSSASARHDRSMTRVSVDAMSLLEAHSWPGNVRELENAIEAAVVLSDGVELTADMLSFGPSRAQSRDQSRGPAHAHAEVSTDTVVSSREADARLGPEERAEMESLVAALAAAGGVPADAAERLGISRATIYRKLKKYGIKTTS